FAQAKTDAGLDAWQQANLREMQRGWRHATCLPEKLVEARSRAESECELFWRKARPANDFRGLLPYLQRVLDIVRETAAIKAQAFGVAPYDALLDEYEPEGRAAEIAAVFDSMAGFLPDFIERAIAAQARAPQPHAPQGPFPAAKQQALARKLMEAVGFDFN